MLATNYHHIADLSYNLRKHITAALQNDFALSPIFSAQFELALQVLAHMEKIARARRNILFPPAADDTLITSSSDRQAALGGPTPKDKI